MTSGTPVGFTHVYLAHCPHGCVTASVVDDPADRKGTARAVKEYVESGRSIERVEFEEARRAALGCRFKGEGRPGCCVRQLKEGA